MDRLDNELVFKVVYHHYDNENLQNLRVKIVFSTKAT